MKLPASVRCWPLLWSLPLLIQSPSDQDATSRPGSVPKQHSSGGKHRLGNISKQGDRYLRSLFTAGALAVIRYAKIHGTRHWPWLTALLARRPTPAAVIRCGDARVADWEKAAWIRRELERLTTARG